MIADCGLMSLFNCGLEIEIDSLSIRNPQSRSLLPRDLNPLARAFWQDDFQ
jgi:hypothetical protein